MRLLNVVSLQFTEFSDDNLDRAKYVIASHRWVARCEATLRDVRDTRNTDKSGYKNILGFAKYVKEHIQGEEWLCVDTCCIDKTNAAELSEAINLIFNWYRDAVLCIAYLADVKEAKAKDRSEFAQSEYFTRGWTLQELLASRLLVFVTETWQGLAGIRESSSWKGDFRYSPLANPHSGTRILKILNPGEQHEPMRCSISHITLDDPPDFTALSYQWGECIGSKTILITATDAMGDRDVNFPVTANLELALRELGRRGVSLVWVDMVCINQEDVSERGQQVAIMGKFYATAAKVVGWTGLPCNGSSTAIHCQLSENREPSIPLSEGMSETESPMILRQPRDFLS
ncbi:hypothetical protein BST61_g5615 [Cercospora zeina]